MEEEYVVQLEPSEGINFRPLGVISAIWGELSGGIGPWGAIRPLFAVALSLVPFLFLGQHFNINRLFSLAQALKTIPNKWHKSQLQFKHASATAPINLF